jgi:transmembrane 9 superfamily protein 3
MRTQKPMSPPPSRYEFFIDDLPIWGFVGPPPEQTKGDSNTYIYTHKSFDIAYNNDRVG